MDEQPMFVGGDGKTNGQPGAIRQEVRPSGIAAVRRLPASLRTLHTAEPPRLLSPSCLGRPRAVVRGPHQNRLCWAAGASLRTSARSPAFYLTECHQRVMDLYWLRVAHRDSQPAKNVAFSPGKSPVRTSKSVIFPGTRAYTNKA